MHVNYDIVWIRKILSNSKLTMFLEQTNEPFFALNVVSWWQVVVILVACQKHNPQTKIVENRPFEVRRILQLKHFVDLKKRLLLGLSGAEVGVCMLINGT